MAERLDIYDINRQKTEKNIIRWSHINDDEFISVVHVCVFDKAGRLLIQKRASGVVSYENMWDISCGGAVSMGETSQESAARELMEELGLSYQFDGIRPKFTINFRHGFQDYYVIDMDITEKDVILQKEEVQEAKFATLDEINSLIDNGLFIPYHKSIIQLIFDSRFHYGSHSVAD